MTWIIFIYTVNYVTLCDDNTYRDTVLIKLRIAGYITWRCLKMAIDGIGGIGALNVSSSMKTTSQTETVTTNAGMSSAAGQIKVESIPPVGAKSSTNNGHGSSANDRTGVQSDQNVTTEQVKAAVEDLNKHVKQAAPMRHTQLSFKYHEDTNRISITVTDSDTDEVIREIPPEKALDMLAKTLEIAGLLIDEKR